MNTVIPTDKTAVTEAPFADLERVIQRRQRDTLTKYGYISLLGRVAVIALAAYIFFAHFFLITPANGNAMFPAVKDGDLIIGFRVQQSFVKDDVVVYVRDDQTYVGRIVARAGDVISISSDGLMQVNGTSQSGEIMYPTYPKEGVTYPYTVPEGCVFVMGDYRTQSEDSRDFGPVPIENVTAKVITILRRRGI